MIITNNNNHISFLYYNIACNLFKIHVKYQLGKVVTSDCKVQRTGHQSYFYVYCHGVCWSYYMQKQSP